MNIKICPSVLACDMMHLEDEVKRAEKSGADMLHLDVMDGVYVPNISFGFDIIKKIGKATELPLDVHMMTCCPWKYLDVLANAGAYSVTVHLGIADESDTKKMISDIHSLGMKAALSVKPGEGAEMLFPFIDLIDMALVMTVEPGFGGQKFIDSVLHKIGEIKDAAGWDIPVQTDGGISSETVGAAAAAGSSLFVVGSASFGASDMSAAIAEIRMRAKEASVR